MSKRKTTKEKRGGAREGAGRPKTNPTKVRRIPVPLLEAVDEMIERYKESELL